MLENDTADDEIKGTQIVDRFDATDFLEVDILNAAPATFGFRFSEMATRNIGTDDVLRSFGESDRQTPDAAAEIQSMFECEWQART